MAGMDELLALYDESGRPCGSAPRSQVRAGNLHHAATGVVVRDSMGRVYVHRRTETKDVFPGLHDFAAGGCVLAGEDPQEAALRELAEELGATDVELEPIRVAEYADAHTRYLGFCYVATYDGPVRWQPEEVACGAWVSLERLAEMLDSPDFAFVPDSRGLLEGWVRERLADRVRVPQGWDSHTEIVEGRWVDRVPRRPETEAQLLRETELMPVIAADLPLAVPVPVVMDPAPLRVRHVMVAGDRVVPDRLTPADGRTVGAFLRALHDMPAERYAGLVPPPAVSLAAVRDDLARMMREVLPLLPRSAVDDARRLLADAARETPTTLVHGDLGPEHLLARDGCVCGVIDWGDARDFDPAIDLAWTLHGTPPRFAEALSTAYGVTQELRERAMVWRRLGPWHEVLWGLGDGGSDYVESGLAGVLDRL
jgi:isopentenyldiphosphate isomerase